MTVNISPQIELKLFDFARQEGIDPSTLIEKMVEAYRPSPTPLVAIDDAIVDPLVARLKALIASAPTDPSEVHEAEEDLADLMRNMNANRAATGERIPFANNK